MRMVIGGAGEGGRHLGDLLSRSGHDVVLIDERSDVLAAAEEALDVRVIQGDFASRNVLRRAEVTQADAVIAATGSDDANVLGAALARSLGARSTVARIDDPDFHQGAQAVEHGLLGIDHVLCTTRLVAAEILTRILGRRTRFAASFATASVEVALFGVHPTHPAHGSAPHELPIDKQVRVAAVARDGFLRSTADIDRLEAGDEVVLAGPPPAMARAVAKMSGRATGERVVVLGGSAVGAIVARSLAERGERVELVDIDRKRCDDLAAKLKGVSILRGDPTELSFLSDIRFEEARAVVAVTNQVAINLLTTLMVTGATGPETYALVDRQGYADLCLRLGIDGTASMFGELARAATELIVRHGLVTQVVLPDLAWSVTHLRVPELSRARTLGELALPTGSIVLAVCRKSRIQVAGPGFGLAEGDDVIALVASRDVPEAVVAVERLA